MSYGPKGPLQFPFHVRCNFMRDPRHKNGNFRHGTIYVFKQSPKHINLSFMLGTICQHLPGIS